jgi:hypothetical protein
MVSKMCIFAYLLLAVDVSLPSKTLELEISFGRRLVVASGQVSRTPLRPGRVTDRASRPCPRRLSGEFLDADDGGALAWSGGGRATLVACLVTA